MRTQFFGRSNYAQATSLPFILIVHSASLPATTLAMPSEVDSAADLLDFALQEFSSTGHQTFHVFGNWCLSDVLTRQQQRTAVSYMLVFDAIPHLFPCSVMDPSVGSHECSIQCILLSLSLLFQRQPRYGRILCCFSVQRGSLSWLVSLCQELHAVHRSAFYLYTCL